MSFGKPSGLSWELLLLELIGEVDEIKERIREPSRTACMAAIAR